MTTSGRTRAALDVRTRATEYWLLIARFSRRYGPAVLTLVVSVVIGWLTANSVSDYTKGGWEIHFIERGIGLNLHFHHWYYGLPLGLLAFCIIEFNPTLSIFFFGLGQTLAAHSFINEGGIPSIIEGGETWRIAPEVYFPVVTALALLYAFFIIRREEWLVRAREREEISESYLCPRERTTEVIKLLDDWAAKYLTHKKQHTDSDTHIRYGHWKTLDNATNSEWQLDYVLSPFDADLNLLVVRLVHIPLKGRAGDLYGWIHEMDAALKPLASPILNGQQAAMKSFAMQRR
jgi:hypothetical protein